MSRKTFAAAAVALFGLVSLGTQAQAAPTLGDFRATGSVAAISDGVFAQFVDGVPNIVVNGLPGLPMPGMSSFQATQTMFSSSFTLDVNPGAGAQTFASGTIGVSERTGGTFLSLLDVTGGALLSGSLSNGKALLEVTNLVDVGFGAQSPGSSAAGFNGALTIYSVAPVPLPAGAVLLVSGLAGLGLLRHRRASRA
jgi:hypothetical protein